MTTCENCKWYAAFEGVCCNDKSEHCADYRNADCKCDKWEGKGNV